MPNSLFGLSAKDSKKFITMFVAYIVLLALSFFYTPYKNSADSNSSAFIEEETSFHEQFVKTFFLTDENDSSTLRKVLTYGIEEYSGFAENLLKDYKVTEESNSLQMIIWIVATCWLFVGFQHKIEASGLDTDYYTGKKVHIKIVRFIYTFFVENAMGYIALLCMHFAGLLILSEQFARITDSFLLSLKKLAVPLNRLINSLNIEIFLSIILIVLILKYGIYIFLLVLGPIQYILLNIMSYYFFLLIIAVILYFLGEKYPFIPGLFGGNMKLIIITLYTVLWKTHQREFFNLLVNIFGGEIV